MPTYIPLFQTSLSLILQSLSLQTFSQSAKPSDFIHSPYVYSYSGPFFFSYKVDDLVYSTLCLPGNVLLLPSFRAITKWGCSTAAFYFECATYPLHTKLTGLGLLPPQSLGHKYALKGKILIQQWWKCGCPGYLPLCPLVILCLMPNITLQSYSGWWWCLPDLLTWSISNNLVHDEQL